jgi:hypothetical protein
VDCCPLVGLGDMVDITDSTDHHNTPTLMSGTTIPHRLSVLNHPLVFERDDSVA